jgi:RNA-directed DNA polymerase
MCRVQDAGRRPDLAKLGHTSSVRKTDVTLDQGTVAGAVDIALSEGFDRFPPLVLDRCMADAKAELSAAVEAMADNPSNHRAETLTMPRRGMAPRPVTITAPTTRALYGALVASLPELPRDGRSTPRWSSHTTFGLTPPSPTHYLVQTDIASCYEYVDHETLGMELLKRTANAAGVSAILSLLGDIFSRPRGLPQLNTASDILADAYLDAMERSLLRTGILVSRVADDFLMWTDTWEAASTAIEDASEAARDLGLVLQTEKTAIRKAATVEAQRESEVAYFTNLLDEVSNVPEIDEFFSFGYGDPTDADASASRDDLAAYERAMWEILTRWRAAIADRETNTMAPIPETPYLISALWYLEGEAGRIETDTLTEIAFHHPLYLRAVLEYLRKRSGAEPEESWQDLWRLAENARRSPWSKVWLLHTAGKLPERRLDTNATSFSAWATVQLADQHEVVRSEAAWFLAGRDAIGAEQLSALYLKATSLTRPALAAATGRLKSASRDAFLQALRKDDKLVVAALDWGQRSR